MGQTIGLCRLPRRRRRQTTKGDGLPHQGEHGMVNCMATTKITITLPDHQLREIRKRVADQESPSVSGFIQQAVERSLENAGAFRAMVYEALQATGGALKPAERAWARRMLSPRKRGGKPRKAA